MIKDTRHDVKQLYYPTGIGGAETSRSTSLTFKELPNTVHI